MLKYTILRDFIEQYKHLPEQGTDEWKKLRKGFIGGSEVATILKQNKNKSINKLILEKLGFDRFQGNVITHWGNVFEEMIRLHCEEVFRCSIQETGSIPYKHGFLSYSPDGLAVVSTNSIKKYFGSLTAGLDPSASAHLTLFEFKCPHSRIATTEIPEHYLPQVSIGMNIIDIMETAIFVQATYRRCSFTSLLYNRQYNSYGHFKQADTTNPPIECGFMVIYSEEINDQYRSLMTALLEVGEATEIELTNGKTLLDIGTVQNTPLLEEVLENCVMKKFKVDYTFRYMYRQETFTRGDYILDMYNISLQHKATTRLLSQSDKHTCIIGVLPFKMLNIHMTQVPKNAKYIDETGAHSKAINVLQCIDDHQGNCDKADVSKSIRRYKL